MNIGMLDKNSIMGFIWHQVLWIYLKSWCYSLGMSMLGYVWCYINWMAIKIRNACKFPQNRVPLTKLPNRNKLMGW